uniref:Uncharacterized protein LOC111121359 n=1 Tax=Crassostrea virginica TaxID=6565 RepID=A0A8B8CSZ1_CRAVI|nr:uncharacterized protein LOC111121359 [Crassostrea virginica]XP_022318320.1 uncharacterized protein LOC111121359 [Crassostrea virginica]
MKMICVEPKNDEELLKALKRSFSSRSFLPLLKEELKCKIQCRRLSEGEDEMKVQFQEKKEYQLSEEEIQKRERRILQNRRSANKRKVKQKQYEEELLARIRRLENEVHRKEVEKKKLAHEKNVLCLIISNHDCRQDMNLGPSSGKLVSLLKQTSP